jgi:hypothetical protein
VDIATSWWEGEAIAVRSQQATKAGLNQIRARFPFRIRELHPDNDSALANDLLWDWCREQRIRMSRSRPYKKNDNAWVEQKNWTHVRKVVGYRRLDNTTELRLLNEIYGVLRLYKNFFLPTIKLVSKTRVEGRIQQVYDSPRTPYQRVLESRQIDRATKQRQREIYQTLNPAELHRKLEELRERLENASAGKSEGVRQKPRHGPGIVLNRWRRGGLRAAGGPAECGQAKGNETRRFLSPCTPFFPWLRVHQQESRRSDPACAARCEAARGMPERCSPARVRYAAPETGAPLPAPRRSGGPGGATGGSGGNTIEREIRSSIPDEKEHYG